MVLILLVGRKIGILISDKPDATIFKALKQAFEKLNANVEVVAPKISGITASDGKTIQVKQTIQGGPSVLYDAIAIIINENDIKENDKKMVM